MTPTPIGNSEQQGQGGGINHLEQEGSGVDLHYDATSFRTCHNRALDKNHSEDVEERALLKLANSRDSHDDDNPPRYPSKNPFNRRASNESQSKNPFNRRASNESTGTHHSVSDAIKSKLSPMMNGISNLAHRTPSIGHKQGSPTHSSSAKPMGASSFDSFDLGPPAAAAAPEDDQPQGQEGSPPLLQQEREPRKKEMSDISEDGLNRAVAAGATAGNSHNHHQDGSSQDTGESTIPPSTSVESFSGAATAGGTAGAEAGATATATTAANVLSPAPSHDPVDAAAASPAPYDQAAAGADLNAGAGLGLSRRHHKRRASHPPKSLTQSDLERGYDTLYQLRHIQQKRQSSSVGVSYEPFQDNDVMIGDHSMNYGGRMGSIAEQRSVRFDGGGGRRRSSAAGRRRSSAEAGAAGGAAAAYQQSRRHSQRLKQDSALEWANDPLAKEAEMIAKMGSRRGSFSSSLRSSFDRSFRKKKVPEPPKKKGGQINERSRKEYMFVLGAGMCLAFNSGYINGACLSGLLVPSGAKVSVAAFTGSYTNSALKLAGGDGQGFGFLFSMILCFIGGSMLTSIINPKAKPYELGPTYGPTFLLGSIFLVISSVLSEFDNEHNGLFYFAAAANGLQNGMSSSYSGNLIRSSHYTGISTDIGLILGQVIRGNRTSLWKLWVLLGLTSSFWMGSFTSWHATSHFRTHSLIFNACFFAAIGLGLITFVAVMNQVTVWEAAFGTWEWERALQSLASVHNIRSSIVSSKSGEAASEEFLLGLFDTIDADNSGTIDEDELYDALREAGMKVSRKGIRAMMKMADENGDGTICREEWNMLVGGKVDISQRSGSKGGMSAKEAADQALKEMEEGDGDVDMHLQNIADNTEGLTAKEAADRYLKEMEEAGMMNEEGLADKSMPRSASSSRNSSIDNNGGSSGFQDASDLPYGVSA